uniref:Uncharacterized protein n=1 Tax=Thermosporothrix sp. COM3 TaxID=2490863 RepID=A0A455SM86_9CHLR|nr:hypothetical protein KTC_20460 [Thermosporothrix sp. COM3]BBH88137.1 hypothetical protein KTC_28880 [Thermosporothrix sp. COM3]
MAPPNTPHTKLLLKRLLLPPAAVALAINTFATLPGSMTLAASAPTDTRTTNDKIIRLRSSVQGLLPPITVRVPTFNTTQKLVHLHNMLILMPI